MTSKAPHTTSQSIDGIQKKAPMPQRITHRQTLRYKLLIVTGLLMLCITVLLIVLWPKDDQGLDSLQSVKARVAEHYVLPDNEEPALATVTDKSQLQTPFLQKAQNGDKILIYQKAQRVIIYRPSIDRIIDVGPVSIAATPDANAKSN